MLKFKALIQDFKKDIKTAITNTWLSLFSIITGITTGAVIYLGLLQRHFFSWRYLAYCFGTMFIGSIFFLWLNQSFIFNLFRNQPKINRAFLLIFSLMMSLLLLFNSKIQPIYYLLPDRTLDISFTIGDLPPDEEGVRLLWIETGQGFVHYSKMSYEGEWERLFGNTIFPPDQTVHLTWTGKTGPKTDITFRSTGFDQEINVSWDGVESNHQLNNPNSPNVTILHAHKISQIYQLPFIISFLIAVTVGILSLVLILARIQIAKKNIRSSKRYQWLLFMLPMLFVWGFTLLVFWPGVLSNDSLFQWEQGVTGKYDDWQSAFHALILAGLMRIWYSPAIVSILQIILLALVVAWGLKTMGEGGIGNLPRWLISLLFAFFPPNWILSITLWKDIPYAIAFLWLTTLILKIVMTRGAWIRKPACWISLSIAMFFVGILRKNGIPSAVLPIIALLILYRKYWKQLVLATGIAVLAFALITGLLYNALEVSRTDNGQFDLIYLHHIAAHLDAGTFLKPVEKNYLDQLLPTSDWFYWCCYVGTISYDNDFARLDYLSNSSLNREIAFNLFLREPLVDLQHAVCAGEMSWKFANNQCYMKSTHGFNDWGPDQEDWIVGNRVGLNEDSKLPGLVSEFVLLLRRFGFLDDNLSFYLRPAFWLFLSTISLAVVSIRRRNFRYWLAAIPIFIQEIVLLLINFAPAYRYHLGTCLAGMFLFGLIFLPAKKKLPL